MKDATFYLLTEIYRILNGNVSGDVFSIEQPHSNTSNLFAKVTSGFMTSSNTKDSFTGTYVANVDVINRVSNTALSYVALDALCNEITALLTPTPNQKGMVENNDFSPIYVRVTGSTSFTDTNDTNYILRRVLNIESRIKQK
jgi:hypothetical protein